MSWRARVMWGLVAMCGVVCGTPEFARAQEPAAPKVVGVDGLPRQVFRSTITDSGDLVLVPPARDRKVRQPLTVIAAAGTYRVDGMNLGASLQKLDLSDMVLSADGVLWALARDAALVRDGASRWARVKLGLVDRMACRDARRLVEECQHIVTTGPGKALVFRTEYVETPGQKRRALGTRIHAISAAKDRPETSLGIPGYIIGPAVRDGRGGFWAVIRKIANARRGEAVLRGYVHYTSKGEWLLWSESGEGVFGLQLKGKASFVVSTERRKLVSDGQGGFYTVGQDRLIYHVKESGEVAQFGSAAVCQYCQVLSLTFDRRERKLHVLGVEWRDGEAGGKELVQPLMWTQYTEDGRVDASELVPLPAAYRKAGEVMRRDALAFYQGVTLHAEGGQLWLVGANTLLHRQGAPSGWTSLMDAKAAERIRVAQARAARAAKGVSTIPPLAGSGEVILGIGALAGSFALMKSQDRAEDASTAIYGTLVGMGLTYLPASWLYPYTVPSEDPQELRTSCLLGGALGVPVLSAASVWGLGRLTTTDKPGGAEFFGALTGAAVGTASSALLSRAILKYDYQQQWKESTVTMLGVFLVNSLATTGYQIARGRR